MFFFPFIIQDIGPPFTNLKHGKADDVQPDLEAREGCFTKTINPGNGWVVQKWCRGLYGFVLSKPAHLSAITT